MTVTSLETSRAISDALGWEGTDYCWVKFHMLHGNKTHEAETYWQVRQESRGETYLEKLPAYDLDYLFRRFPQDRYASVSVTPEGFGAVYNQDEDHEYSVSVAETPPEAAGLLILALAKAGVLKREDV